MADPIRIGHIALSFHEASALEVAKVLKNHGHEVTHSSAPHEAAFEMLAQGEVDLLAAAWLPSSHAVYLDPLSDQVDKLTVLYEPYCIWGVPDTVLEAEVASVEDLLREPALGRMERLIQGINPGAGISRFGGELRGYGAVLRSVVVQGKVSHQQPNGAGLENLAPGSYFGSKGKAAHQIGCNGESDCVLYVRTKGKFDVVPSAPPR